MYYYSVRKDHRGGVLLLKCKDYMPVDSRCFEPGNDVRELMAKIKGKSLEDAQDIFAEYF